MIYSGFTSAWASFDFDEFCDPACRKLLLCSEGIVNSIGATLALVRANPTGTGVATAADGLYDLCEALYGAHDYITATMPAGPPENSTDAEIADYWGAAVVSMLEGFGANQGGLSSGNKDALIVILDGAEDSAHDVTMTLLGYSPS